MCTYEQKAGATGVALQESAWASETVALDEKKQATTHSAQSGTCLPQRSQQVQRPCVQGLGRGVGTERVQAHVWKQSEGEFLRRAEKVGNDNGKGSHRRSVPKAATSGLVYTIHNLASLTLRAYVACQGSTGLPSFPLPLPIHRQGLGT